MVMDLANDNLPAYHEFTSRWGTVWYKSTMVWIEKHATNWELKYTFSKQYKIVKIMEPESERGLKDNLV